MRIDLSTLSPYRFVGLLLVVMGLAVGCSQQNDAFLNRTYHRLTARDNGWFNANEKLKEVVFDIEDTHVDDYDEVLPLFVYGTPEKAKSATPDLEKCIDKCSLVIERHSMDIKGKEKNAWIDDAWFVIAKSQFYKGNYYEAERGFTYVSRRFKGREQTDGKPCLVGPHGDPIGAIRKGPKRVGRGREPEEDCPRSSTTGN